ncbi:hypothetical protein DUNSADRAFT_4131 [Dunaliella salina]|uniref:Uncharacterized protein n=1 Tax=Dunaliella salina TaxID=3046 RepID=A0ABQ7GST5_DUNSA|nr:hypothetical protein DUNSADRAFT_4131 [Dunaliella salina]|eukprot:KAF5837628.1 hypothetical protein DUNSADRAFT_4131 [Dunaliella salina]
MARATAAARGRHGGPGLRVTHDPRARGVIARASGLVIDMGGAGASGTRDENGAPTPEPDPVAVAMEEKRKRLEAWKAKKAAEAAATGAPGLDDQPSTAPAQAAPAVGSSGAGTSAQGTGADSAATAPASEPAAAQGQSSGGVWVPWGEEMQPSGASQPAHEQEPEPPAPAPTTGVWMPWEDSAAASAAPAPSAAAGLDGQGGSSAGAKEYGMPEAIAARKVRLQASAGA